MVEMTTQPAPAAQGPRRNVLNTGVEIAVNVALPFAIFSLAQPQLGDAHALLAASAPPLIWSAAEFARRRRIDALSMIVLTGIGLSLIAFFGGGGVRFLQLRETLVGGVIGLIFLGSAAIDRPLIYYLARASMLRSVPAKAAHFAALRGTPVFKRTLMILTLSWGVGLVAECALASALTFVLPIQQYMLVSPVIGYGVVGLLSAWTVWLARRRISPPLKAAMDAARAP